MTGVHHKVDLGPRDPFAVLVGHQSADPDGMRGVDRERELALDVLGRDDDGPVGRRSLAPGPQRDGVVGVELVEVERPAGTRSGSGRRASGLPAGRARPRRPRPRRPACPPASTTTPSSPVAGESFRSGQVWSALTSSLGNSPGNRVRDSVFGTSIGTIVIFPGRRRDRVPAFGVGRGLAQDVFELFPSSCNKD